jgi:tetratricopeptide (TPR) repeat protein
MPSHTYNRIGRWGSAVTANIQAWHSDQRAAWGEGVSYAATHNLHMLLFAASMDGQGAVAAEAARAYANAAPGGEFYVGLVLVRFGKFDEVLALSSPPEQPIQKGLWEFARGYAHLRTGAADSASVYLARVDEAARVTPENVAMRGHTAAQLLGITGDILRAEILREEGDLDEAIGVLERAVATQDGLRYDEPEPLNFSARHWLGAALLEAGRPEEAQAVYEAALVQHPRNGWSLFGLEQALRAQEKGEEASDVRERLRSDWARSDTLIRSSRF